MTLITITSPEPVWFVKVQWASVGAGLINIINIIITHHHHYCVNGPCSGILVKTKQQQQEKKIPYEKPDCLHSSEHLSLLISPFTRLLIHQAIIISLSFHSHPSLTSPSLIHFSLLICCPCLLAPVIPSVMPASVCLFLSLLNTVVRLVLSPVLWFFFFSLLLKAVVSLPSQLQCHLFGILPH